MKTFGITAVMLVVAVFVRGRIVNGSYDVETDTYSKRPDERSYPPYNYKKPSK